MSLSIEFINKKLHKNFKLIKKVIAFLQSNGEFMAPAMAADTLYLDDQLPNIVPLNIILDKCDRLIDEYNIRAAHILVDYYSNSKPNTELWKAYQNILISNNVVSNLDELFLCLCAILSRIIAYYDGILYEAETSLEPSAGENLKIARKYFIKIRNTRKSRIAVEIETEQIEICDCGAYMTLVPEMSEMHCRECGQIRTIAGTVFKPSQFYSQDGQRITHGGYNTSRHFQFHIERLQGRESKTFSAEDLEKIRDEIHRRKINLHNLTCRLMRDILKTKNLTNLNNNIPLLIKILGGPPPPQLTLQEEQTIGIKFNLIMRLYKEIQTDGKNNPYYPYFIYKIIETHFEPGSNAFELLKYIHLQKKETLVKHDRIYKQICSIAHPSANLIYKPTVPLY